MSTSKVVCSKISVDCIENDPVDIRAGGSPVLGFDFYVKEQEESQMVELIKTTLNEYRLPLMGIEISEKGSMILEPNKVWDSARIIACIEEESDYIRSEAEHQKIYQKQN